VHIANSNEFVQIEQKTSKFVMCLGTPDVLPDHQVMPRPQSP
jgi:hypothetical protein